MSIIEVKELEKVFRIKKREAGFVGSVKGLFSNIYEEKKAVDNISFNIEEGEMVGYIGPNGAGKSTTIKILVGILLPTLGQVKVKEIIPYDNRKENAKNIGVVFGQRTQLWWDIPVSETLNLLRHMYKVPLDVYKKNLALFRDILDIDKFINIPVRQLSLGQRMRADICAALIHNPPIVYFDEPTIGLDVVVKENIRTFIKEVNRENRTTVLLTTHDVRDIEKLCSRVMVIDKGQIMYDGSLELLKKEYEEDGKMIVVLENPLQKRDDLEKLGIRELNIDGNRIIFKYNQKEILPIDIINYLMIENRINDFKIEESEIENVIRNIYLSRKRMVR
jgi:ABC-2 type transport system ATP-binding protein